MNRFLQRPRAFWGSFHVQDIAEYAVMLAVILLLVVGTIKLIGSRHHGTKNIPRPAPGLGN